MATTNDKVISTLNKLIETCKDGEEGFKTAAEGVNALTLRQSFREYSLQRVRFARELSAVVQRLGGEPAERGTPGGSLHRGWMNIRSAVTRKDEGAIISECERGEGGAEKNYQEALAQDLPADVRKIMERQAQEIKQTHDRILALEKKKEARA
jgi:uncharacterized protein (TIGR02284 family)